MSLVIANDEHDEKVVVESTSLVSRRLASNACAPVLRRRIFCCLTVLYFFPSAPRFSNASYAEGDEQTPRGVVLENGGRDMLSVEAYF